MNESNPTDILLESPANFREDVSVNPPDPSSPKHTPGPLSEETKIPVSNLPAQPSSDAVPEQTLDASAQHSDAPKIHSDISDVTIEQSVGELSDPPEVSKIDGSMHDSTGGGGTGSGPEIELMDNSLREIIEDEKGILDPVEEKLLLFLKDSSKREIEFAGDISSHERYLVHRFVTEHGLTCESTGSNANHKFMVKKSGDEEEELDYGAVGDDNEEKMDDVEENIQDMGDVEGDVVELFSNFKEVETVETSAKPPNTQAKKTNQNEVKFDVKHVNPHLTLRDLKLENFSGCYKMDKPVLQIHVLRNICESAKVSLQIVVDEKKCNNIGNPDPDSCKVSIYMNDIHVSDGFGKNRKAAKECATRTAIRYLQHKGVTLWDAITLEDRFVVAKPIEDLGEDKTTFKRNFQVFMEEFIMNPNIVQLRVVGKFQKHVTDDWKRSEMISKSNQYHLRKEVTNNVILISKSNSILHNLPVYPTEEGSGPSDDGLPNKYEGQNISSCDLSQKFVENPLPPFSLKELAKTKYDRLNVSSNLRNLRPLKLDQYQGVVSRKVVGQHNLPGMITEMTEAVGVSCEFDVKGPFAGVAKLQWRASLSINKVFIAKGFSKTESKSRSDCAKNAFHFLLSVGLNLIFDDDINDGQIKKVEKAEVESSSIREQFSLFQEDKNFIKMKFCYRISETEKELFEVFCEKYNLTLLFEGTGEIMAVKKNTHLHKMELIIKESEQTVPSVQSVIVISKEDLTVNSSIRDHIQQFVNNDSLLELRFPENLDVTQKELIEVLSEKHKLKHDVDGLSKIILSKDPDDLAKVLETKTEPSFSQVPGKSTKKQKQRVQLTGVPSSLTLKVIHQRGTKRPIISIHDDVLRKTFRTDNNPGKQRTKPNPHLQKIKGIKRSENRRIQIGAGNPAQNSGGNPARNSGGNPARNSGGNLARNSGGNPARNSGGNPARNSGGNPARNSGGNPARNSGGNPARNSGGNPARNSGGTGRTYSEGWRNNEGEVGSQGGSGMDFSWVSAVVNRAVNTAVTVNSATRTALNHTSNSATRTALNHTSNSAANRNSGVSLLRPPYLSEESSPSSSSSFSRSQAVSNNQYHAKDWQSQTTDASRTQIRGFTSHGSQNRSASYSGVPGYQQNTTTNYQTSGQMQYPSSSIPSHYQTSSEDIYSASSGAEYQSQYSTWSSRGGSN